MKTIRIKSNFARDKVVTLGGEIDVVFNEEGLGEIPACYHYVLDAENASRPGRFHIIEDSDPLPEIDALKALYPDLYNLTEEFKGDISNEENETEEHDTSEVSEEDVEQEPAPVLVKKGRPKKNK